MDKQYKKLVPSIYLHNMSAVRGLTDYGVLSGDPAQLAAEYDNGSADALLIFDLSDTDKEQEAHNDIIRQICSRVRIPVIAAGRVRRMEDVKKFLYAGCAMAGLNLSKDSNAAIAAEVADKFGADKIAACFSSERQVAKHEAVLKGNISCLIYVGEEPYRGFTQVRTDLPVIAQIGRETCVMETLLNPGINGVTGSGVNERIGKLRQVRDKLASAGIPVRIRTASFKWEDFKLGPDGLLPVVVQEASTSQVLMVAYMNEEAYNMTVATGRMTYWSRSRSEIWVKGLTSGHFQYVHSLTADCDMDTLLARVEQIGAACHTGSHSCFFNTVLTEEGKDTFNPQTVLLNDYQTIVDRRDHPKKGSYTNYLFEKGLDKMLKKLGEEATEIVIAAKNPNPNEIVYEISDYLYHLMVVMAEKGITWEDVTEELARRQKKENSKENS